MKYKLWVAVAAIAIALVLLCGTVSAVTKIIDGYTATGTSRISQSSIYAPVIGSGTTAYTQAIPCSVVVNTKMRYTNVVIIVTSSGSTVAYYPCTKTATASHVGGAPVTATCNSGGGSLYSYFFPDAQTSTHIVNVNGRSHVFESSAD